MERKVVLERRVQQFSSKVKEGSVKRKKTMVSIIEARKVVREMNWGSFLLITCSHTPSALS